MKIMKLSELIDGITVKSLLGPQCDICSITFDSRSVTFGSLFVAVKGTASDGHHYIDSAVAAGAKAIICEVLPDKLSADVVYVEVEDSSKALGLIASKFFGTPSSKLKLVGVTGTNGKTTTATLLYNLFSELGYRVGLISTVEYIVAGKHIVSSHTTPDSIRLNQMLSEMVEQGCEYCFMEVSSHSIVQNRISGLNFAGGIFTNITHDHLDYHHTFAEYIKAKKGFFDILPKGAFALYNADDKNGSVMVQNCKADISSFALKNMAKYRCRIIESLFNGMLLSIDSCEVWVRFIGEFNAYNVLGVYAAAVELGQDKDEILTIISRLTAVAGRFEYILSKDGKVAVVDYAHTPDALVNVIETINKIKNPSQKLYTVVGCGGNRDKTKRPVMAKIAASQSDFAILTSDNPRKENPDDILKDMTAGLDDSLSGRYVVISDRYEAIKMASVLAKGVSLETMNKGGHGDIILIAGKGHENYQEIDGVKHHFDDKEQISRCFGL